VAARARVAKISEAEVERTAVAEEMEDEGEEEAVAEVTKVMEE